MSVPNDADEWQAQVGPHVSAAIGYAEDVVDGRQVAGRWIRLAAQRFLDDLHRDGFPFYFDVARASRACQFIEQLPHIEGIWAARGELIRLEPWQCFLVAQLFGWRHVETGLRRFRTAHWEVARKNAKSTLAAAIALTMLVDDGEQGAKVYSAATKRDQARIVFGTAREMALRAKARGLEWTAGLTIHQHALLVRSTASKFEALDGEGSTLDGLNVHCSINDELHAWKRRDLYEVIETATGARSQPLILNITTAGYNISGVCYEQRGYGIRLLQGIVQDETYFPAIWTLDEDDDPWLEANWPKANPNYGVSVYPDDMRRLAAKAKAILSQQNGFKTKRLNVWCSAESGWLDVMKFQACADPSLRLEDFEGEPCVAAVDVAEKRDVTSRALMFEREIDGARHYFAFFRRYLPRKALEESTNPQYAGWVEAGRITPTDGNIIDLRVIEEDLRADSSRFQIESLSFDPHNATALAGNLSDAGMTAIEFRQTPMQFDEPMRWLEAVILEGRFHFDGDPVLAWMVSNVVLRNTGRMHEFRHPRKERPDAKIDDVVVLCMCMARFLGDGQKGSIYDERGVVVV